MSALRRLYVCADDHGLSPAISRGIERLALAGRLSGVSCIVNSDHWPQAARGLSAWPREVDLGLHFNLTEGVPLSDALRRVWPRLPSLPRLLAWAHLGRLPLPQLGAEWQAQVAAFTQAVGRRPRMVDGHQHVHHLPGIRQIVLAGLQDVAPDVMVRNTGRLAGPGFGFKRWVIERSGGRALQSALQRLGVRHNPMLVGAYDFADGDHRHRMQQWLAQVPPRGAMLFCHPGMADAAGPADAIATARVRELAYLESDAFPEDLRRAGVELGAAW